VGGTFLFPLFWQCKVVPFEQLLTRFHDRPANTAEFMSTICRESKIDFTWTVSISCSSKWSRFCSQITIFEVFTGLFEYRFYWALSTLLHKRVRSNVWLLPLLHYLTLWEPVYDIFILRFRPKKQQFSVALPMP